MPKFNELVGILAFNAVLVAGAAVDALGAASANAMAAGVHGAGSISPYRAAPPASTALPGADAGWTAGDHGRDHGRRMRGEGTRGRNLVRNLAHVETDQDQRNSAVGVNRQDSREGTRAASARGQAGPPGPAGPPGVSGYEIVTGPGVTCVPNSVCLLSATCPAGKRVLGGGWIFISGGVPFYVTENQPIAANRWRVVVLYDGSGISGEFVARAVCATA